MKAPRAFSGYNWLAVAAGLVVLIAGGWYGLRHFAGGWLNERLVERYNRSAAEEMARGDHAAALVLARRSLQRAPDNLAAWRLAVAAARHRDQPDAIYYQENLARLQPTKENEYELIRLALHFGFDGEAVRRIKAAASTGTNEPAYLRLAAQAYLRQGNTLAARFHLLSLTALDPADNAAQLDLALIDLAAGADGANAALRRQVRELAEIPALRLRAITGLLQDAIRTRQPTAGLALMPALEAETTPAARLLLLEAAYAFTPEAAPTRLRQTQLAVAAQAKDAADLIDFMAARGDAPAAIAWAETIPAATRQTEDVRRALADCHLGLGAWDRLRTVALEAEWDKREFLRRALLAYSYRELARRTESIEAWNGAVSLAGTSFQQSRELLVRVETWRWRRERFDVLWKLFGYLPGQLDLRRELATWEHDQGNTANLQRLFGQVIELAPNDHESRANFAYCNLLLDSDITASAAIFRELTKLEPQNPYYVTGQALALLKQDRAAPALANLSRLRPAHLAVPERMSLHAWLLALNGRFDEAEAKLAALVRGGLLPEERKWAESAEQEIARHRLTQSRESQLAAGSGPSTPAQEVGWLTLLETSLKAAPSVDMRLADQLLARRDLPALARLVRNADWRELEHVRLALLAYALRSENPAAAREAWTHAVTCARQETDGFVQLERLTNGWRWTTEQIEVLNILHQQAPGDRNRLGRLLAYYREKQRTPELIRVLRLWTERAPDSDEALLYTYYCLLTNVETSRAIVAAGEAYGAKPADADRVLLHAFALDRAGRSDEAVKLLQSMPDLPARTLPAPVILAAVWSGAGQTAEAIRATRRFDAARGLPEEIALIRKIAP
jgi:Flp pilus assembly protein TadD